MNIKQLIKKGYLPKELPPCFNTNKYSEVCEEILDKVKSQKNSFERGITNDINSNSSIPPNEKAEAILKAKETFNNSLRFSEPLNYTIPKIGLARNTIKIPNPMHQAKLAIKISENYEEISKLYDDSNLSTTKPIISENDAIRAVEHNNYGYFKEQCILTSFNYAVQLKTDISKFYSSIYTHTIPWVTFGGKEKYKKNRKLNKQDPQKISDIYGDEIDNRMMWCQNQQTKGIPIGPDTSLIIAEILACHIDKLLSKKLKIKKINWLGFRYYDDYMMYFNSELDAQIALTELNIILSDFELSINDDKTHISQTVNELERPWAIDLKSFMFKPNGVNQKLDIWNFFSLAFKHSKDYPTESVLKLALNKFGFIRIEKEHWDFFESLLFRLGLSETSSLQKISKILITYESLVSKQKLKSFCFEIINRHYAKSHDYELTWALWLLQEFNIQPTKDIYIKIFNGKSIFSIIIALPLSKKNKRIKNIDFSNIKEFISTENLNSKYWMLIYEVIYNDWITDVPSDIIDKHLFFKILKSFDVSFFDTTIKIEPLKIEQNNFIRIEKKIKTIDKYMIKNNFKNQKLEEGIDELFKLLSSSYLEQQTSKSELNKQLNLSKEMINNLLDKLKKLEQESQRFEKKKIYFVLGERFKELNNLTNKEITLQLKETKNLLFDPEYD